MATTTLTNAGASTASVAHVFGNAQILNAANAQAVIINDTSTALIVTTTVGADVNFGQQGVGVNVTFDLPANSFQLFQVTKNAGTNAADGTVTVATGGAASTHGTSAQFGQSIYFDRVN